jgi:hypothetical protein
MVLGHGAIADLEAVLFGGAGAQADHAAHEFVAGHERRVAVGHLAKVGIAIIDLGSAAQMPQLSISTSTSSGPGSGSSMVS